LNNIKLVNVPIAVGVNGGATVLPGGNTVIHSWGQGNVFKGANGNGNFIQGDLPNFDRPASLLDGSGRIFGRTHPQYADYSVNHFVSVKDHGAKGDGHVDDTLALQNILNKVHLANFLSVK
jgi:glucan 1,3-beta-glucosidase